MDAGTLPCEAPAGRRPRAGGSGRGARAGAALGRLLLLAGVLVLAATFVPTLLGLQRYVLVGRSMEPTIARGSLVFDEVVPRERLRPGDVITYVPPGARLPVTHRVISVRTIDGQRVLRTQGDNNPHADLRPFVLRAPVQARVKLVVPHLGWIYIVLSDPRARLALLVVPAALIALVGLVGTWREGGRLLEERTRAGTP